MQSRVLLQTQKLKCLLDDLYVKYSSAYLDSDPAFFPHQYKKPIDIEIVSLISSVLAYGKVDLFKPKISYILDVLGKSPSEYIFKFDPNQERKFDDFIYRFNRGPDIRHLLFVIKTIMKTSSSVGNFFMEGYHDCDPDIEKSLYSFVNRIYKMECLKAFPNGKLSRGFKHLFPIPGKSACKRLNMFLRWMIRKDDIDFGLWNKIPPSKLIIPLDTHVARLAGYLGLTERRSPDWKMAAEVTQALKKIDLYDPVKYDFALSRLGILNKCPSKFDKVKCAACQIKTVCARN